MILKSFAVENNLSILDNYSLTLLYGENIGFKDEIKHELKKKYSKFEKISFTQDEIIKKEKLLDEQIHNTSLFNENKIIFISEVSDKIKKKIEEIGNDKESNIKIFLFAQNLDKKSTLRSLFEKKNNTAIIACYQDNHRALTEYLKKKLSGFIGLNQETCNLLIENCNLDRKLLFYEIKKIEALFLDKKINFNKLANLINQTSNIDFDRLRDSCFEGDSRNLNKNLGNIILLNEDVYFYLNNLNLRLKKFSKLHDQFKIDKNIESAIDNLKPKIFWKDKPAFLKQFNKWNIDKIEKAKNILLEAEIVMKTKFNNYNVILMKNTLIRLYRLANSTS